jgi:hypothetical protein
MKYVWKIIVRNAPDDSEGHQGYAYAGSMGEALELANKPDAVAIPEPGKDWTGPEGVSGYWLDGLVANLCIAQHNLPAQPPQLERLSPPLSNFPERAWFGWKRFGIARTRRYETALPASNGVSLTGPFAGHLSCHATGWHSPPAASAFGSEAVFPETPG